MATKDITDLQVVHAYEEMRRHIDAIRETKRQLRYVDEILARSTGQPLKVCQRAMERAYGHGLVEYGMWLRGGWLTDAGKSLFTQTKQDAT